MRCVNVFCLIIYKQQVPRALLIKLMTRRIGDFSNNGVIHIQVKIK